MKDINRVHAWSRETPPLGAAVWAHLAGYLTGIPRSRYVSVPTVFCPHILVDGRGTVRVEGKEHAVGEGDMFCLWPGVPIEYRTDPDAPWSFYWMHLMGEGVLDYLRACGFVQGNLVRRPTDPETVASHFRTVWQEMDRRAPEAEPPLVAALYAVPAACGAVRSPVPTDPEADLVAQAVAIIDAMLANAINVNELARTLRVSRTTLFRAFRRQLGCTPMDHLTQVRIQRARELLRSTDHKLAVVARACGFRSEKYFLRRFHERTGQTPGAFRTQ